MPAQLRRPSPRGQRSRQRKSLQHPHCNRGRCQVLVEVDRDVEGGVYDRIEHNRDRGVSAGQ
jgi:hypothetical protein